jgi:hypothetical protein
MINRDVLDHILPKLEELIRISLENNLTLHSSLGGKYGEYWVASQLWSYGPRFGGNRSGTKGVKNPNSADIVLETGTKKIEVKWGRYWGDGKIFEKWSNENPCWGWGFSKGRQFKEKRFNYCVLLAAEPKGAYPKYVFVLDIEEMNDESVLQRTSSLGGTSYYIEYSEDEKFYNKQHGRKKVDASPIEKLLFKNREKYTQRWERLKEKGEL